MPKLVRKSLWRTIAVRRSNEIVETKRKVCIIVAKVLTGVDQQSKLVDITMYVIKLSVHFFIVPIRRVRICFVRDMSVVNLLNERRPYTAFENMVFPRIIVQ